MHPVMSLDVTIIGMNVDVDCEMNLTNLTAWSSGIGPVARNQDELS